MDELRQVVDVVDHSVVRARQPLGIPVAPEVERQDVPIATEALGDPIPVAAVIEPAVDEHERRGGRVAPVDVVQAQALREEEP